ncbi:MAG: hypothetical protein Q4G03_08405 [Planctomycetia bacterium]|nr:hypothetical protein [Planctomycetia bacterium]
MLVYYILCGILAIGALAFWHSMRTWSITLVGFNLMFATLFAIGLFEMLANIFDGFAGVMAYYNDMLCFLLIFTLVLVITSVITSKMTKIDLWFSPRTELISSWVAAVLIVLSFCSTGAYVFFLTMPDKPMSSPSVFTPAKPLTFIGKGSLKPLIGGDSFDLTQLVQNQQKRNAGVYEATVEDSTWKFDGDSPNAQ